MQFSQVIFVLILESMKNLILQYYYVCMSFLTRLQPMFHFYNPCKDQRFFEKGTKMEHLKMEHENVYVTARINPHFQTFMLCKFICISEL